MSRGVDRRTIFADDVDRSLFMGALNRLVKASSAHLIAYCLMGNHFHLAIKVGAVALSSIMQRLLAPHAAHFNERHGRTGHLFEERYTAKLCLDDKYLAGLIPYIHNNPVRAGLVASARDWAWSSVHQYPEENACPEGFDPWPKIGTYEVALSRDLGLERIPLDSLAAAVAFERRMNLDELQTRARNQRVVAARRQLTQDAVRQGHTITEIAAWLKTGVSSVSRYSR
jgi:putative transposase